MNNVISNASIANNSVSPPLITIKKNRLNNAYAFYKKVVKHVPSTRNCLMLISSTISATTYGAINNISKYDKCNSNDAMFASLLSALNTILPTFLCMVLYAMVDATEPKDNNTSVITTADKNDNNDYEDIEKNMMSRGLIEDKSLSSNLLTKIKLKLIDIKNNIKNIDKSEAFIYLLLMFLFMLVISVIEYFILSDCSKSIVVSSAIMVPVLAFLLFSLPVMVIRKIEGMSID